MTNLETVSYLTYKRPGDYHPLAERMERLMALLGDPQKELRFVHVAGTNGKGSTSCLIASALQAAGYRTGLYTSPHLVEFSERIRINGVPIPPDALAQLAERVRSAERTLGLPLTAFDRITATAFLYFAQCGCDIVVLEVGLGGALDATNVIEHPEVCVFTNIGLDHTEVLGDTLEKIAAEKAGIFKPGCPAVSYPQQKEAATALRVACRKKGASLSFSDFKKLTVLQREWGKTVFTYRKFPPITLALPGEYQTRNAAVALDALTVLRERGWSIPCSAIQVGFLTARWPGRFERLAENPVFLLDGGHNPQCAEALAENLAQLFPKEKFIFLLGMMRDKDAVSSIRILAPLMQAAVAAPIQNPRAMKPSELCRVLEEAGIPAQMAATLPDGVGRVRSLAGEKGIVCAFGSLYLAGELYRLFGKTVC